MKKLNEKIRDGTQPVIFYELLPPSYDVPATSLSAYVECAMDLLIDSPVTIDAVNIPDVRIEEADEKNHGQTYKPKIQPGYFAQLLEQGSPKHLDIILNHCTVYEAWPDQKKWLKTTIHDYNVNSLILVGGSSSKIKYPGPSVLELSHFIHEHYKNILCGAITIQTRRYADPNKDEPFKLFTKSLHGIEFFTTQIVYDSFSIQSLLRDYAKLCHDKNVKPKRIFLSFAPISNRADLDFLRWLGVVIPKSVEENLFKADIGIGWRSAKIATTILQDILQFLSDNNIEVPIGLNIEHITRHNFELSIKFVERLGGLYYHYLGLGKHNHYT